MIRPSFPSALALPVVLALSVGGCSLIPDYLKPEAPVPQQWPQGEAYKDAAAPAPGAASSKTLAELEWKDFFRTPELRTLIQMALDNNRDLRVAALNIQQARAEYRVTEADELPTLDAGGSLTRARTAKDLSGRGRATTGSTYNANVSTTAFEVDLFGRVRSLEQQALEQFFATEEAQLATRISLVAEVANAYLTLVADRKLLSLTEETLKTQQESYALVARSYDHGIGSKLDEAQARTSVETAKANRAMYLRQVAQDRNALTLLVGKEVDESLLTATNIETGDFLAELPVGVPSEVMLRRPDIRRSEHLLKAANANIGAARAAFYPSITLTGSAGYASTALGRLFDAGSGAWSFMPQISLPIFDNGRNQANLDSAVAARDITVAQYEQSIQTAFREVADALAARGTLGDQLAAQQGLVNATGESYQLSRLRYNRGIDSYLNVLDAQRSLYSAQQTLISVELSRLSNLVTLYKVLGGGA